MALLTNSISSKWEREKVTRCGYETKFMIFYWICFGALAAPTTWRLHHFVFSLLLSQKNIFFYQPQDIIHRRSRNALSNVKLSPTKSQKSTYSRMIKKSVPLNMKNMCISLCNNSHVCICMHAKEIVIFPYKNS